MSETPIRRRIMFALGSLATIRLFKNPVGVGYIGAAQHMADGSVLIRRPRRVSFGLFKGAADLIGWRTVTITPDMVGKKVAVFVSVEVKDDGGRVRPEQENWARVVRECGGLGGIARSEADARAIAEGLN